MEISDNVIFALLPATLLLFVGLLTWIVKDLAKGAIERAEMKRDIHYLQRQIDDLQDG